MEEKEEKIKKWEEEIERTLLKQKEMNQKYNDRIRELRKRIQETESEIRKEENLKIAEAFREIYGGYDADSLEAFRSVMRDMKQNQEDAGSGQEAPVFNGSV